MRRMSAIALALVFAAAAWLEAQIRVGTADSRFVGNWRLVSFVNIDDQGASTPSPFTAGRIMYDAAGQMAAQLTHANRAALPANPSDALRAAASAGYVAYYGGYRIEPAATRVIHLVEGSTNPNWPRTDLVRYFEFADGGDTLKLSIRNDAGRTTGTLTWARIR